MRKPMPILKKNFSLDSWSKSTEERSWLLLGYYIHQRIGTWVWSRCCSCEVY